MACTINLAQQIISEAQRQGVDPNVALAVAKAESGICQWYPNGSVVTSSKGALGVFQLLPSTAAALGVDPLDLDQNIRGGIAYLKQLLAKYGNWTQALAAYNFGPGKVDAGASWPTETINYIKKILGFTSVSTAAANQQPSASAGNVISVSDILGGVTDSGLKPVLIIGGLALVAWWLWD